VSDLDEGWGCVIVESGFEMGIWYMGWVGLEERDDSCPCLSFKHDAERLFRYVDVHIYQYCISLQTRNLLLKQEPSPTQATMPKPHLPIFCCPYMTIPTTTPNSTLSTFLQGLRPYILASTPLFQSLKAVHYSYLSPTIIIELETLSPICALSRVITCYYFVPLTGGRWKSG